MLSQIKEISDAYDDLYNLTETMTKRYSELVVYSKENCPEVLKDLPEPDFKKLYDYKKLQGLYDRAVKMNLLK